MKTETKTLTRKDYIELLKKEIRTCLEDIKYTTEKMNEFIAELRRQTK